MATKEGEARLSPRAKAKVDLLMQALQSGKAQLKEDSQGRPQIVYANERTIPLGHVDKSKVLTIQVGKDADDTVHLANFCLETFDDFKRSRAPSGVVIDQTKIRISRLGQYRKDQDFVCTGEVLGKGNCAGDIVVAMDKETGTEHALKTVMISVFSTNEVRALMKLHKLDFVPSLYLFRLDGNKVALHMEKVEHGVTLTDIIDRHMANLCKEKPELIRPFSLCMFHDLLSAVGEMHGENWAHCDLHGKNVMITKEVMMLMIFDFGMARPLREGLNFNHNALKSDILNAIRLFCGVYIGWDFGNNFILEKEIKAGTLKKVLTETAHLSKEDREELLQLIMMTYQVTQNPQQAGYSNTTTVLERIEGRLFSDMKRDEKMGAAKCSFSEVKRDLMMRAAKFLFPEFYGDAEDIAMR